MLKLEALFLLGNVTETDLFEKLYLWLDLHEIKY